MLARAQTTATYFSSQAGYREILQAEEEMSWFSDLAFIGLDLLYLKRFITTFTFMALPLCLHFLFLPPIFNIGSKVK